MQLELDNIEATDASYRSDSERDYRSTGDQAPVDESIVIQDDAVDQHHQFSEAPSGHDSQSNLLATMFVLMSTKMHDILFIANNKATEQRDPPLLLP
jgi:hypothetical protein